MGHSLGGALALEFAYHQPQMVERLFLVDSEGVYGAENIFQLTSNFFRSHTSHVRRKAVENIKAIYRIARKLMLHLRLAHYAHHIDLQKEAREMKVPTTILWGEQDHLTPLWQGQALHQAIPGSKLIILKEMDHDWILHSPELFWENVNPLAKVPD